MLAPQVQKVLCSQKFLLETMALALALALALDLAIALALDLALALALGFFVYRQNPIEGDRTRTLACWLHLPTRPSGSSDLGFSFGLI